MPSRFVANAELIGRLIGPLGQTLDFEHMLERTYRRLICPGQTVLDVGAHTGRHTFVLAEIVGPAGAVHAFEPLPEAMAQLRKRLLPPHVHLHEVALGSAEGPAEFIAARGTPEESGLRVKIYNRPDLVRPERIRVRVSTLDTLAPQLGEVAFIKIDVEGAEIDVLRGGRGLITRARPWITVEYGYPGYSAFGLERRSLFDEAEAIGYVIGDMAGAVCDSLGAWEAACDRGWWDWHLIPRERVAEWTAALAG